MRFPSLNFLDYKQKLYALKQSSIEKKLIKIDDILKTYVKNNQTNYAKLLLMEANIQILKERMLEMQNEMRFYDLTILLREVLGELKNRR